MKSNRTPIRLNLAIMLSLCFFLSNCTTKPTPAPSSTASAPTLAPTASPIPTSTQAPTATPIPLPTLTLRPGDFYFSVDGTPGFVFSRNVAGTQMAQYATLLDWSKAGGTRFVRVQLDSLGMGYTNTGALDSSWATQWDRVLDQAEVDDEYVLLTFTAWYDWNGGSGYSTWNNNPINQANGGPANNPGELFQKGSPTQKMWLNWMETVIKRWQGRRNILSWEIFSEVNLASGNAEANGIDFVNAAAAVIRAADPSGRPVTASMADTGTWPNFYHQTNIDFINLHPYPPSGQLDRAIVSEVRSSLALYHRPLLIGESGLSAATPDSSSGKLTVAANAERGIRHAIWAGVVSGAMNGRALWWEDGVGIFFQNLGIPWMQTYKTEELPAANFVAGVDFTGFQPLPVASSGGIWGAAIGNGNSVLGWFRDAGSEPPDWKLQPVISKQTLNISVPGSAVHWRVDFYSTRDGTTQVGSVFVTRQGNTIPVPLPDFQDDIAFKMSTQSAVETSPTPVNTTTEKSLPPLALTAGDMYFSLNGKPTFFFSRNIGSPNQADYATILGMAHAQGDLVVRMDTTNGSMGGHMGYGYTSTGEIREDWSKNWEQFFDQAEAEGMYVIPTFTGWVNWNSQGFSNWGNNPFRSVYGGPAADPTEIFKRDSPTQLLYLKWFKSVVTRWSSHKNILVWEVITEANLIDGIDEADGVYLCEQLAKVAHQADPLHRPVTANLADNVEWQELYRSNDIDFISIHPYPATAKLDTATLAEARSFLAAYHKPVLIGESGLSALDPDTQGKIIEAPNAQVGLQHAIWAEVVSGAMNGRGLWFEDSFALFTKDLGMTFVQKNTDVEAPAYRFINGMDMTGFAPVSAKSSGKILGAALGNDRSIIGWFRDAGSEPPDWTLQPVISKQTVTLSLASTAASWKVDFYSAQDGTTVLGSTTVSQNGSSLSLPLPDFKDDIAFKMSAQGAVETSTAPVKTTTSIIAGTWNGTITNAARTFSTPVKLSIQPGCTLGNVCGTFSAPQISCSGDLYLQAISAQTFLFQEQNVSGSSSCQSGGYEQLQLQSDGTISYSYLTSPGSAVVSTAILRNP